MPAEEEVTLSGETSVLLAAKSVVAEAPFSPEAVDVLGGQKQLSRMLHTVLHPAELPGPTVTEAAPVSR